MSMDQDQCDAARAQRTQLRPTFGIIILAIVAVPWLIWGPLESTCYVGGLFNLMSVWVLALYLAVLVLPALVLFPVLVAYTSITWPRQTRRARRRLVLWMLATGGFAVPLMLGFAGLTASPFDMYIRGFARYAERCADIEAMQDWLSTLNRNEFMSGENSTTEKLFSQSEQPPCITRLHPRRTIMRPDDAKRLTVRLLWGGGFIGHWGIEVGPADMPTPPSDASKFGVQRFPLAPGAYVWSSE